MVSRISVAVAVVVMVIRVASVSSTVTVVVGQIAVVVIGVNAVVMVGVVVRGIAAVVVMIVVNFAEKADGRVGCGLGVGLGHCEGGRNGQDVEDDDGRLLLVKDSFIQSKPFKT